LLKSERFIDTMLIEHYVSDKVEHHALRIASLVKLILNNVDIHPVTIYSNNEQNMLSLSPLHRS
jgi:hypothetical protein